MIRILLSFDWSIRAEWDSVAVDSKSCRSKNCLASNSAYLNKHKIRSIKEQFTYVVVRVTGPVIRPVMQIRISSGWIAHWFGEITK